MSVSLICCVGGYGDASAGRGHGCWSLFVWSPSLWWCGLLPLVGPPVQAKKRQILGL